MPRKKSYRRRTYRKKRDYSLQQQINWLKRQSRVNRPELEFNDITASNADIFTTPTIRVLNTASEGQRCTIKSIQANFKLALSGAQTSNQWYRIVIFTDKSNESGAVPTWAKIYKSASGADAVMSLRHIASDENEGQRFKILFDRRYKLIKNEDGTTDNIKFINFYKKLNMKSILTGDATYWESNGLYLAFVGTTPTTEADLTYQIRLRFVEMGRD